MSETKKSSFVHLHTHTEYSMLDGAARVKDLVKSAVQDGQTALGITDHGNMYGVLDFYKECKNAGINPIIGTEAYMSRGSRYDRPQRKGKIDDTGGEGESGEKLYYHLTVLAESTEGYHNLMKLSSQAFLEGYYYKPRVDFELLETYKKGLIVTTGCLGGLVLQSLLKDDYNSALNYAGKLKEIFGEDNLFVEVQDHGLAEQKRTNPQLVKLASELGLPLLATNDSHYTKREDSHAHEALLCVQTGSMLSDPKRFKFEGSEHYLKSSQEMRDLFREIPQACDSSLLIAERSNVDIQLGNAKLPQFPIPSEFDDADHSVASTKYLRYLAFEGAKERWGDNLSTQTIERLEYELRVIKEMGFDDYFLVVWDLIKYARDEGIRVGPGRGSAAGCCVAYCLKIVDVDPLKYGLIFERFLNPGRKQMPDIDMDFDERYRGDMIKYAASRYGNDHVAQIVTFSTIKARAAVRDAARVLGLPYTLGDKIAKAMPPLISGRDTPLAACFTQVEGLEEGYKSAKELREIYNDDPQAKEIIDVAKGLEGLRRQDGIHAAAVVISAGPLTDYLPIQRKPDSSDESSDAPVVTQYEMHGVEDLGLLKMDFLGLRNLSIIERCLDLIEESIHERINIDDIPLDDERTFEMLRKGDSVGVFQLEGAQLRTLMRQLAPTSFDDVAALIALYRPGPMAANMHKDYADIKNGRKAITYLHPDMEEVVGDTYGLMMYQESVMRVAQKFAGYTLEEADNLRKACGKKIKALIQGERKKFVDGCEKVGYGKQLGEQLFDIIEPFADYAFNKSHSYGYGLVSYQTAYLKANYPVQYMASLLSSVKGDKDKTATYLSDARAHGITVEVPDINLSGTDFSPKVDENVSEILFGLSAVRNVGEALVDRILIDRDKNGPYNDFYDFCFRSDPSVLNKRTLESLIKAGAFSKLGHSRKGLLFSFEEIVERVLLKRKDRDQGIQSLFDMGSDEGEANVSFDDLKTLVKTAEFEKQDLLKFEKEMLGLYVSDHPLIGFESALAAVSSISIGSLKESFLSGDVSQKDLAEKEFTVAGVVTGLLKRNTKRGDQMATFTLEDLESTIDVMVFPKVMSECGDFLSDDIVVRVTGRLDLREGDEKFVARRLSEIDLKTIEGGKCALTLKLPVTKMTSARINELQDVLVKFPGETPVRLRLGNKLIKLPEEYRVSESSEFGAEIRIHFGDEVVEART